MCNVGLLFGSFDPIHQGHLSIGQYFLKHIPVDEVWFVITPQNPLKKKTLTPHAHRLKMVALATEDNPFLKACTIEFSLQPPYHTYTTLELLRQDFPTVSFCLLIGEDNLRQLEQWVAYQKILDAFPLYVYPRVGCAISAPLQAHPNIRLGTRCPIMEISSTAIRKAVQKKEAISETWLPEKVMEYIGKHQLYSCF